MRKTKDCCSGREKHVCGEDCQCHGGGIGGRKIGSSAKKCQYQEICGIFLASLKESDGAGKICPNIHLGCSEDGPEALFRQ